MWYRFDTLSQTWDFFMNLRQALQFFSKLRYFLLVSVITLCSVSLQANTLLVYQGNAQGALDHTLEISLSDQYIVTSYGEYDVSRNTLLLANPHSKTYSIVSIEQAKLLTQKAQQIMDLMGGMNSNHHLKKSPELLVSRGKKSQYLFPCESFQVEYKNMYRGEACFAEHQHFGLTASEKQSLKYAVSQLEQAFAVSPYLKTQKQNLQSYPRS